MFYYNRPLKPNESVQSIYEKVKEDNYSILLESSDTYIAKTSEFSIISAFPEMLITLRNAELTLQQLNQPLNLKRKIHIQSINELLNILNELLSRFDNISNINGPNVLPFLGGFLGYISYDFIRYIEKIPHKNIPEYIADLEFILTKNSVTIDHRKNRVWIIAENEEILEILKNKINTETKPAPYPLNLKLEGEQGVSFTEEEFIEAVNKTKDYISQGEIYQANISLQFSQLMKVNPYAFYKKLYMNNPSPFCSYIHIDDLHVICNSPERLIKSYVNGRLETRPIAGTRSRGMNIQEDEALEREMISSSKERSEHIMLVDLERNDIGKVSKYGSVNVDELFSIEKYSHVMHLVSNIKAKLNTNYSYLDLIPAMFPGGTITGVPKIRCMEIIEELENRRRGLYTGSIGYIDFRGSIDFNIVIRTMTLEKMPRNNYFAKMQFGAGIVADSIGKYEYKECMKKGRAIFDLFKNNY